MTAELILDAMNELPDHLLEQTEALRQRKPVRWQPLAAAACLCLMLGIAYSFVVAPAEKGDNAAPPQNVGALEDAETTNGSWWLATVTAVEEDRLTAVMDSGAEVTVLLTELAEKPALTPGQRIRIYLKEETLDGSIALKPYKIEIEEESP